MQEGGGGRERETTGQVRDKRGSRKRAEAHFDMMPAFIEKGLSRKE